MGLIESRGGRRRRRFIPRKRWGHRWSRRRGRHAHKLTLVQVHDAVWSAIGQAKITAGEGDFGVQVGQRLGIGAVLRGDKDHVFVGLDSMPDESWQECGGGCWREGVKVKGQQG